MTAPLYPNKVVPFGWNGAYGPQERFDGFSGDCAAGPDESLNFNRYLTKAQLVGGTLELPTV